MNVGKFFAANEALEKVSSYGLAPNMILYLMKDYGMGVTKGQNLLFFWSAATNFLPLLGAFLADSYLGRFLTIAIGSVFSFLVTSFSIHLIFFLLILNYYICLCCFLLCWYLQLLFSFSSFLF